MNSKGSGLCGLARRVEDHGVILAMARAGLALAFLLLPALHWAQVPDSANGTPAQPTPVAREEEGDKVIAELQKSLGAAKQSLLAARTSLDTARPTELGATRQELDRRITLLTARIGAYERHIAAWRTIQETRRASKELATESDGWTGFPSPPPYPLSLVDDSRGRVESARLEIQKLEVLRSLTESEMQRAREALEKAEQEIRQMNEKIEREADKQALQRLNWLRDLAEGAKETAAAQALSAEAERKAIQETSAYRQRDLQFAERRLKVAVAGFRMSQQDFDKKMALLNDDRAALEKELEQALADDQQAQGALDKARAAIEKAVEPPGTTPAGPPAKSEDIQRLQDAVASRRAVAETTAQTVDGLRLLMNTVEYEEVFWRARLDLMKEPDPREIAQFDKKCEQALDLTNVYAGFLESRVREVRSLMSAQQRRLAMGGLSPEETALAGDMLAAYQKRAAFLERAAARLGEIIRTLEQGREDAQAIVSSAPLHKRLWDFIRGSASLAGRIWNYELFAAEDTVIVNGQAITQRRPVTIGKVVVALLLLTIGIWLYALGTRSLARVIERRTKADRARIRMVQRGIFTFGALIIVMVAFIIVKIPLTAFAFLGGALAIGIGFGAQNLVNNFISGIILFFERPIKVGDIVEVDGKRGEVLEVGTRCSQIRLFDGSEILVPNSVFLEKTVMNLTHADRLFRYSITVGVAYGSPVRDVSIIMAAVVEEHGKVLKSPAPDILFNDFGDNALMFGIYYWLEIKPSTDSRVVASDLRYMLERRLREAGIVIAYPQRDVHLDLVKPVQVQLVPASVTGPVIQPEPPLGESPDRDASR